MQARLLMLFVVCACASLAGGAATATATTAPGTTATVPVKLTNSTIKVAPDVFTEISSPKVARYPRGATIVFKITNNGTAPLTLRLRLLTKLHVYGSKYLKPTESTKPIAPHGTTKLKATFAFRGNYQFELLRGGKIVAKNAIFIF